MFGLPSSFMTQVLLNPRDVGGSSSVSASSEKVNFHLPAKAGTRSPAAEAWLPGIPSVPALAGSGDPEGCTPGPPLFRELCVGDAGSAGDAQLTESSFCKNCFKRVFLRTLFFEIALRR